MTKKNGRSPRDTARTPDDYTTATGQRKRGEENKNINKKEKPVRIRERVSTSNAFHYETVLHRAQSFNGS